MKVLIDKNVKCNMFREILGSCSDEEKGRICTMLNEEETRDEKVLHLLMLLFCVKKHDITQNIKNDPNNRIHIPIEDYNDTDYNAAKNSRKDGNDDMRDLIQCMGAKMQTDQGWDIDLQNDDQNYTTLQIYKIPAKWKDVNESTYTNKWNGPSWTYVYRDSLIATMIAIDDNDTIQARIDKLQENLENEIKKYCEPFGDARREELKRRLSNACDEEVGDEDVETWLTERSMKNLQGCCDKLLRIINECGVSINPETYFGIQLWVADKIASGNKQIILTGAPGTGKTRMATNIAEMIGSPLPWDNGKKYEFVQFHPSYDYTDFMEGLRPVTVKTKGADGSETEEITFKKMDGIFKRFCRWAAYQNKREGNADKVYYFIIDEINRADLSKVFGELMYCLESDKRGRQIKTQYQNLDTYFEESVETYFEDEPGDSAENLKNFKEIFKDGFYIPKNVVVIGTMNDIDRSVESMDYALRRRFTWKEVEVKKGFLESAFESMMPIGVRLFSARDLAERVDILNQQLKSEKEYGLNEHYFISQGQFAGLMETMSKDITLDKFIEEAWDNNIKLLIAEYVRGEDNVDGFLENCKEAFMEGETVAND